MFYFLILFFVPFHSQTINIFRVDFGPTIDWASTLSDLWDHSRIGWHHLPALQLHADCYPYWSCGPAFWGQMGFHQRQHVGLTWCRASLRHAEELSWVCCWFFRANMMNHLAQWKTSWNSSTPTFGTFSETRTRELSSQDDISDPSTYTGELKLYTNMTVGEVLEGVVAYQLPASVPRMDKYLSSTCSSSMVPWAQYFDFSQHHFKGTAFSPTMPAHPPSDSTSPASMNSPLLGMLSLWKTMRWA